MSASQGTIPEGTTMVIVAPMETLLSLVQPGRKYIALETHGSIIAVEKIMSDFFSVM